MMTMSWWLLGILLHAQAFCIEFFGSDTVFCFFLSPPVGSMLVLGTPPLPAMLLLPPLLTISRCQSTASGRQSRHGAYRGELLALQRSPGTRVRRWASTNWQAVLHQLGIARLHQVCWPEEWPKELKKILHAIFES